MKKYMILSGLLVFCISFTPFLDHTMAQDDEAEQGMGKGVYKTSDGEVLRDIGDGFLVDTRGYRYRHAGGGNIQDIESGHMYQHLGGGRLVDSASRTESGKRREDERARMGVQGSDAVKDRARKRGRPTRLY